MFRPLSHTSSLEHRRISRIPHHQSVRKRTDRGSLGLLTLPKSCTAEMTDFQQAYFPDTTGPKSLMMPYPSDNHFPFCPLVVAQLHAVVCQCGNPADCMNLPSKLPAPSADGSINRCGLTEAAGHSMTNSTADSPFPDEVCRGVPPEAVAADAQASAEGVRALVGRSSTRSLSKRRPSGTEGRRWCTEGTVSSCSNLSAGVASADQYAFPSKSVPACAVGGSTNPSRERSGSPDAPTVQHFIPNASVNLLCCTRWKHVFTPTSDSFACKTMCNSAEEGKADCPAEKSKLCSTSATSKERRVVCGLLIYEGQHFFEGRLLYEQLNGGLRWNGAAWERLYCSFTQDVPSTASGLTLPESHTDAVGRPRRETQGMTGSPRPSAETTLSSCMSTAHGNKTFIVLHVVGNYEPQRNSYTVPCATIPSLNLQRSTVNVPQHSPNKEDVFKVEGLRSPRSALCAQNLSTCSVWSDSPTEVQPNSSGSGDSHAEWSRHWNDASVDVSASKDSVSPASERPKPRILQNSCSPAHSEPVRATERPTRTRIRSALNGQPVQAYTLSVVMELGAAPYAVYVRITEPIRLQPLIPAAGVAKLSTAVLRMQHLYKDEQLKLKKQYNACMEALQKTTEESAAVTAQRQKREDTLLKGACILLNEKKRKLAALRQRVLSLEKELENARCPGGFAKSRLCGCRAGVRAVGDQAAVLRTSKMTGSGRVQNNLSVGMQTNVKTLSCRGLRADSNCVNPALTGGQASTRRLPAAGSGERAASAEVRSSKPDDRKKRRLRDTDAASLFLVRDKNLFPAAFACVSVKEESPDI